MKNYFYFETDSLLFIRKNLFYTVLFFCLFMFAYHNCFANNISVSNISLIGQNTSSQYTMVKFDISWENSWRTSSAPNNWDAAWVFVKYRIGSGAYQHAWLNNTGHLNPSGSTISTGLLDPSLPFNPATNPGLGVFIYRDADGTGSFSKTGVQLRWNYGTNGISDTAIIDIRVYAIEHVYVPQGSFFVGTGGSNDGSFYKYPVSTNPFQINGEGAIIVGTATDNLYYQTGSFKGDGLGPVPSAFPKGYKAFYCMKYEISQQGYVDFLKSITSIQATNRYSTSSSGYRYGIMAPSGVFMTLFPYVVCNFLSWADVAAYLDWCGLRPMTELEFEKACRGTLPSVPQEYAWGTTGIAGTSYTLSNINLINENIASNYSTTQGNAVRWDTYGNPLRVGIFAGNTLNTGRVTSGATYYGIMEMSGNMFERIVTLGNPSGRGFTGYHGNGEINSDGNADVINWPGISADGSGYRGGSWGNFGVTALSVSDRIIAALTYVNRDRDAGGRGVRTAP